MDISNSLSYKPYLTLEREHYFATHGHVWLCIPNAGMREPIPFLANGIRMVDNYFDCMIPSEHCFVVSFEGNIGAGKTSAIEQWVPQLRASVCANGSVAVMDEQVARWQNVNGENLLQQVYQQPHIYSDMFQNHVPDTMLDSWHRQLINCNNNNVGTEAAPSTTTVLAEQAVATAAAVVLDAGTAPMRLNIGITDRSPQTSVFVFSEESRRAEYLTRKSVAALFERIAQEQYFPQLYVYLYTEPHVAYYRMRRRNRAEECALSLYAIEQLHIAHNRWLLARAYPVGVPVLMINATYKTTHEIASVLQQQLGERLARLARKMARQYGGSSGAAASSANV